MITIKTKSDQYFSIDEEAIRWFKPICEYADEYWWIDRKFWWIAGKAHRVDGPAIKRPNGDKEWWFDGKRHRIDGPTIEDADGYKAWWADGKRLFIIESTRKINK